MQNDSNVENIKYEKIINWIDGKLIAIRSDARFQSRAASIFSNAPLALIQASLTAEENILEQVKERLVEHAEMTTHDLKINDDIDENTLPFI